MSKQALRVILVAACTVGVLATPASAKHNKDQHSDNMSLVANFNPKGEYGLGSDLAFWGNMVVAGSYQPGGFRLIDVSKPSSPQHVGIFQCPGTQADVSIWEKLVFVSVDAPRGEGVDGTGAPRKAHECGAPTASQAQIQGGTAWEGIRIVSIADPAKPVQIAAVRTQCGSHTHTLNPDPANKRLLVYVLSYPLNPQSPECNAQTHRKISVIEVPLAAPETAKVISMPDVSPAIGCHDMTVFVTRRLGAAACISESQMWDLSDPVNPKVVSHIVNPRINIHHSTAFSWDGDKLVLGDELGGAAASPGCVTPEAFALGGLWFYDVKEPENPTLTGAYTIPQALTTLLCTAHLFNPIPLRSDKDILAASWYTGATTVVDFTDPANAKQIAYYIPAEPVTPGAERSEAAAWSSYWYNGQVYSNNFHNPNSPSDSPNVRRGLDVFGLNIPELVDEIRLPRLNPQIQEPLPPATTSPGAGKVITPQKRRCVSRRTLTIRLRAPKGTRIRSAVVFVKGRRVKVIRGKRLRARVDLRGLPRGRFRVDITVRTTNGRRIHSTRYYRTCRPKRRG